jgi:hypothetical protein
MRIHNVLCHGVMLLGAAAPLAAFGQFQAPTAEELKMTSDPKAPGADAVYLYLEETEDDDKSFRTLYVRIKVLTEKGKELATVQIGHQQNVATSKNISVGHFEVAAISARTIHPDGTVIPLAAGQAADLMSVKSGANQVNTMTFNLPSVEVGSILEYRYQLRYDRFFYPPHWQIQQPYFVHKAHYVFLPFFVYRSTGAGIGGGYMVGGHGQILTDVRALPILPPGRTVQQDTQGQFVVDLTDVPPIPREDFAPPLEDRLYQVEFYYTYTAVAKEYWQKETQFWLKDVDQYTKPTGAIRQAVSAAVSPTDSPLDKAKKLYDLVQKLDNTDFAASAGPVFTSNRAPGDNVETVLEHKSGNGNDIALLYLALARAAGLEARPEWIASRDRRIFNSSFQHTSQLDAVVIAVTVDGKEIVLDPACKMAPFQTLHWSHAGAGGVALGGDGKVESIITPLQDNRDNTVIRVGSLNIGPEGSVSGTLKVGFIGQQALEWRQRALKADASALKGQLESELQSQVPDGVQIHIDRIAGLDDPGKQLVAVLQVTGTLGTRTGSHLILPRLFFDSKATDPFPAEEVRSLPVDVHYAAQEQEQITYVFPTGFALEGTPEDASMKWEENAAYKLVAKADATSITSARILARGFTLLGPAEYGRLRDFYDKVALADHQQLALSAPKPAGK